MPDDSRRVLAAGAAGICAGNRIREEFADRPLIQARLQPTGGSMHWVDGASDYDSPAPVLFHFPEPVDS